MLNIEYSFSQNSLVGFLTDLWTDSLADGSKLLELTHLKSQKNVFNVRISLHGMQTGLIQSHGNAVDWPQSDVLQS